MAEGPARAVRVRITGRVQGVGFRAWARDEAARRGLSGWARNEADGSVAALIAGPEAAVAEMLEALAAGPPPARVDRVETDDAAPPEGGGFRVG